MPILTAQKFLLLKEIRDYFRESKFCDATFICRRGEKVAFHSAFLALFTPVIKQNADKNVFIAADFDARQVKGALLSLYGDQNAEIGAEFLQCLNIETPDISDDDDDFIHQTEEECEDAFFSQRCDSCARTFKYRKSFESHSKKCETSLRKVIIAKKKENVCGKCDRRFSSRSALRYHDSRTHRQAQTTFKCPKSGCSKTFKSKAGRDYHVKVHDGRTDFLCDDCGKGFVGRQKLIEHRRAKHDSESPFRCEICDKSFNRSDKLKVHIRRFHTGEKPFKCDKCDFRAVDSSGLIHHRNQRHRKK